jgi:hypothetical protein
MRWRAPEIPSSPPSPSAKSAGVGAGVGLRVRAAGVGCSVGVAVGSGVGSSVGAGVGVCRRSRQAQETRVDTPPRHVNGQGVQKRSLTPVGAGVGSGVPNVPAIAIASQSVTKGFLPHVPSLLCAYRRRRRRFRWWGGSRASSAPPRIRSLREARL